MLVPSLGGGGLRARQEGFPGPAGDEHAVGAILVVSCGAVGVLVLRECDRHVVPDGQRA